MPGSYRIDAQARVVYTTYYGRLTFEDLPPLIERAKAEPDFDPAFSELIDLRQVEAVDMNYDDFARFARIDPFAKGSKRAVVATAPQVFGVSRMFQTLRESHAVIEIFPTMEEARRWLGLDGRKIE